MVILNERNFVFSFQKIVSIYSFLFKRKKVEPSSTEHLVSKLFHIFKTNGINYLILYMKTALWALNCFVGKIPLKSTKVSGMRIKLSNGLPYIIPPLWRKEIRKENIQIIRLTACILNVYKALQGVYTHPDISSILSPLPELPSLPLFTEFCKQYFVEKRNAIPRPIEEFINDEPPLIFSAGPNNSVSSFGFREDCVALFNHNLWPDILRFAKLIGNYDIRGFAFGKIDYELLLAYRNGEQTVPEDVEKIFSNTSLTDYKVGKLSLKFEAAGKIRVFAIGDYYTQWVLKPLHEAIFAWLRSIHSDATFDQNRVLSDFIMKNKGNRFWSFDLKSATDLIPRPLYHSVLSHSFLNDETATLWANILDRVFAVPKELQQQYPEGVRYGTGQPMGFLSSWATLALVHHMIVRFAWFRVHNSYHIPNYKYLVLGDDLVISDPKLAAEYLEVVKLFSIPITRYKSFENATIANFASQVFNNQGINISGLSLKEMLQADSLSKKLEFATRLARLGFIDSSLSSLFRTFFTPELWKSETPHLTKGQLSPYGRRVYRCLCQPRGRLDLLSTYLSSFEQRPSVFNPPLVCDRVEYLTGLPIRFDKHPHITKALQSMHFSLTEMLGEWQEKVFEVLNELNSERRLVFNTSDGEITLYTEYKRAYQGRFLIDSTRLTSYGRLNFNMLNPERENPLKWTWKYPSGYDKSIILTRLRESYFLYMQRTFWNVSQKVLTLGQVLCPPREPEFSPLRYVTDLFNLVNSLPPVMDTSSIDSVLVAINKVKKDKYQQRARENFTTRMILGILNSISDVSTWYSPPPLRRSKPRKSLASKTTRISKHKHLKS